MLLSFSFSVAEFSFISAEIRCAAVLYVQENNNLVQDVRLTDKQNVTIMNMIS